MRLITAGRARHNEIFKKILDFSDFFSFISVNYNYFILFFIRNSETYELTYSNLFSSLHWESVFRNKCCSNHGLNSTDGLFSFGGRLRHIIFRVYHWRSLINRDISLLTGLEERREFLSELKHQSNQKLKVNIKSSAKSMLKTSISHILEQIPFFAWYECVDWRRVKTFDSWKLILYK